MSGAWTAVLLCSAACAGEAGDAVVPIDELLLRIGPALPDSVVFTAISGATRLPDGGVLVGDRGDYAILQFDARGALIRRFARKGKGPGEITILGGAGLTRCGSSIFAQDIAGSTMNEFTLDGAFVRRFRFAREPYRMACNDRPAFVSYEWEPSSAMREGRYRVDVPYWISGADSLVGTSLGMMPSSERWGERPLPLGKEPRVALSVDRAYVATGDSIFVRVFDLRGAELPPLHRPSERMDATDADWKAELDREVAMMGERWRPMITEMYGKIIPPKYLPATRDILVDAAGNIWVQHYPRAAITVVPWTVFAPDGRVLMTRHLPTALEVYEIGADYVLGRYADAATDVPEVRVYKLKR